jgi:DNA/RNA endonuclease YhcR with UshA esterase domain
MADTKISALPASTTPLAGTEVLPIVQSSATKQVSVANLTAGRAISATQLTLTTGNLIVASGQGIDFTATAGTGTSELFADYEEGTFTATLTCGTSGTITINSSFNTMAYTKIGRVVHVQGGIRVSAVSSPTGSVVLNLPFTSANLTQEAGLSVGIAIGTNVGIYSQPFAMYVGEGGTEANIQYMNLGSRAGVQGSDFTGDEEMQFGFSYIAA